MSHATAMAAKTIQNIPVAPKLCVDEDASGNDGFGGNNIGFEAFVPSFSLHFSSSSPPQQFTTPSQTWSGRMQFEVR